MLSKFRNNHLSTLPRARQVSPGGCLLGIGAADPDGMALLRGRHGDSPRWKRAGHFRESRGESGSGLELELGAELLAGLVRTQTLGPRAQGPCFSRPGVA